MKKKGFTLIEVVCVLMSIAILIPVIAEINMSNIILYSKNRDNNNMYLIAMSLCEMYKKSNTYYDDLKCNIYLNSSYELLDTIDQNIFSLNKDNSERFIVILQFKYLDTNLYQLSVEVKDRVNGDSLKLSSYK
ncbi:MULTISPECIES: type II secretion system protein [Caloramator]|uniref:type II secretion system protein n=1 Tax=Caloramator TaxID=44258 RepID=UPI001356613D|nr:MULTISPECIES: type II secretion system protein [Caloramator]